MSYSVGEAAKATGVSKSTLSRAIKSGRISASRRTDGSYSIDPSELHRVYAPISSASPATVAPLQNDAPRNPHETPVLEAQLDAARELLKDRDDTIADLRRRLDQAEGERREAQARVVGLLTDQRPIRRGFWSRLFGASRDGE
jgi:excisionase family DNA binding protein